MRNARFLLAPIAAAVLAACAVGPNYHAPETKAAEKFDGIEPTYSTEPLSSEGGTAAFWQSFADSELGVSDHLGDAAAGAIDEVGDAAGSVAGTVSDGLGRLGL